MKPFELCDLIQFSVRIPFQKSLLLVLSVIMCFADSLPKRLFEFLLLHDKEAYLNDLSLYSDRYPVNIEIYGKKIEAHFDFFVYFSLKKAVGLWRILVSLIKEIAIICSLTLSKLRSRFDFHLH